MARTVFAVFCVFLAASALYAADADRSAWYIGIEGSAVRPANDDLILGTPVSGTTGGPSGSLVTLDYGTSAAYAFKFGYGTPNWDVAFRIWWASQDDEATAESTVGFLPAFENPLFGDTFANRLDGTAELKTTLADIAWSRKMASTEKSRWDWTIGLRSSKVEQESTMTDDATTGGFDDQVVMKSEATGIGVVGGIGGRYDFKDWMWGSANLRMAFLTGKLDVSRSETAFGVALFSQLDGAQRMFRQGELDVRLNFRAQKHVVIFLGYEFKQLDGSAARLTVPDDTADGIVVVERSDVAYSGFSLGAVFSF